jgi:hypothetical protein
MKETTPTQAITLFELLRSRGFIAFDQAKMARHEDKTYDLQHLVEDDQFVFYQGYQSKHRFNLKYLVSFFGRPGGHAVFHAIYFVKAHRPASSFPVPQTLKYPQFHTDPGRIWYDLDELPGFDALRNRVVIDWGNATRQWCQFLRDCEVIEIRPKNDGRAWPGYLHVMLGYKDLQTVIGDPHAYRDWHQALSATPGVYLILDKKSGKHYVGSATSEDGGILQRWKAYSKNPSGGNVELKEALAAGITDPKHWQFTILQNLSRTMTPAEVVDVETLYKQKLGTRVHGWNKN